MIRYAMSLYDQFQMDLAHCKRRRKAYERHVETCFHIAYQYNETLNAKLNRYEFSSEEKEISFFKKWKPWFTAQLEFCKFVYHFLLFPPSEFDEQTGFWKREYPRLDTFRAEPKDFLSCYYDQRKDLDTYYFIRRFYKPEHLPDTHGGKADRLALTNGDPLAGTLLALE